MNARALMTATAGVVLAVLATAGPASATGGGRDVETTVTEVNYQELTNKVTTEQKNEVKCKDEGDINVIVGAEIKNIYNDESEKCSASNDSKVDADNDARIDVDE